MTHAFSLSTTYVHLRPDDSALAMEATRNSGRASRTGAIWTKDARWVCRCRAPTGTKPAPNIGR